MKKTFWKFLSSLFFILAWVACVMGVEPPTAKLRHPPVARVKIVDSTTPSELIIGGIWHTRHTDGVYYPTASGVATTGQVGSISPCANGQCGTVQYTGRRWR